MDFATRNLYRTAIEQIARGTELTELEIARRALARRGDGARRRPTAIAGSAIPATT